MGAASSVLRQPPADSAATSGRHGQRQHHHPNPPAGERVSARRRGGKRFSTAWFGGRAERLMGWQGVGGTDGLKGKVTAGSSGARITR